jgi:hypothetical protein
VALTEQRNQHLLQNLCLSHDRFAEFLPQFAIDLFQLVGGFEILLVNFSCGGYVC